MGETDSTPGIFIVSGGVGASGEQIVHTLLAQFPAHAVRVTAVGNVRKPEQIADRIRRLPQRAITHLTFL